MSWPFTIAPIAVKVYFTIATICMSNNLSLALHAQVEPPTVNRRVRLRWLNVVAQLLPLRGEANAAAGRTELPRQIP